MPNDPKVPSAGAAPSGVTEPVQLRAMAVDVTTSLGSSLPVTPVGLGVLERLMAGGLRTGDFFLISGSAGVGKTALALHLGYIAARSAAETLIVSVTVDEAAMVARFAARALHREHPDERVTYGQILSGEAWKDEAVAKKVRAAVNTVVTKVGTRLYPRRVQPFERLRAVRDAAAALWKRNDRVVVIVDGLEAFTPQSSETADPLVAAAFELRALAQEGCAVVATMGGRDAERAMAAATLAAELTRSAHGSIAKPDERLLFLGARNVDLVVTKNHAGPTGLVPLRLVAGAATFEERAT